MAKFVVEDPVLLSEWDYEKNENLGLAPDFIKLRSNKEVWWKCSKGHSYKLSPDKRSSTGQGCYYCSNRRLLIGYNDLKTMCPDIAKDWDYELNPDNPEDYTKASMHVAHWVCSECGYKWSSRIRDNEYSVL